MVVRAVDGVVGVVEAGEAAKDFEKRGGKTKVRLFRADASRTTLAY